MTLISCHIIVISAIIGCFLDINNLESKSTYWLIGVIAGFIAGFIVHV